MLHMQELLELIRKQRQARKLSQKFVGDKIGIGRENYNNFENGRRALSRTKIIELAEIIGLPREEVATLLAAKDYGLDEENAQKFIESAASAKASGKAGASGMVIPPSSEIPSPSSDVFFESIQDLPDEQLVEAMERKFGLSRDVMWALIKQERERGKK